MEKIKTVLIVAGEASGDMHAASLVKALKDIGPAAEFFGVGGQKLKREGVELLYDMTTIAVVGFFEVLRNFGTFRRIFRRLLEEADRRRPDVAILVDYPGFNLRLAAELKKRDIPVIYYISPQVWAWGQGRINTIKRLVNTMIVVLPFEEDLYRKAGVPVVYTGHPLLDVVKPQASRQQVCGQAGLDPGKTIFALLPGSRQKEVKTLLPIMLETAGLLRASLPEAQFLLLRAPSVPQEVFDRLLAKYPLPVRLLTDMAYDGVAACDFALVASGTATLETAIIATPMVILYKVSFLTWAYMKAAIRIPYIGLANVVRQEKLVAEFIQYDARPSRIADYIIKILQDPPKLAELKRGLAETAGLLGKKGASLRAAQVISDFLAKNRS
ncbi:MAG TPA: lipid-A-disaccharide synthase [Patescibacteria group bacterium]|nr:lipid-A-disaccharide synthase [Patescibacteria group bacterium]